MSRIRCVVDTFLLRFLVGAQLLGTLVWGSGNIPVASSQTLTSIEDSPVQITLFGNDPAGRTLSYRITRFPESGKVDLIGNRVTYVPDLDSVAPDRFGFKVSNGIAESVEAMVIIYLQPVNDAPIAIPQAVMLPEDSSAVIQLSGYDVDGDKLTFELQGGPVHGSLDGVLPNLTYRPDSDYSGEDQFRFRVHDGKEYSGWSTVKLLVASANDAPVAIEQTVALNEDDEKVIELAGRDADGDTLSFSIVDKPTRGILVPIVGAKGRWTYRPNSNYFGGDRFSFRVKDASSESATASVYLDIRPVNDAPIGNPLKVEVQEDSSVPVLLSGSDLDGDSLNFRIIGGPAHGRLLGQGANQIYRPNPDYYGNDSIRYVVNDGRLDSSEVVVDVSIAPMNDAPIAVPQIVATLEDTPVTATLNVIDPDGDSLKIPPTVVQAPSNGILEWRGLGFRYIPKADFNGTDRFTYWVSDGIYRTAEIPVTIVVASVNDGPRLLPDLTTTEDTPLSGTFPSIDADGDLLTYRLLRPPEHGTLKLSGVAWSYLPALNYNGLDAFTYVVSDGVGVDQEATVGITVTPVNDPPVAKAQTVVTAEETPVAIRLEGSDAESDSLVFKIFAAPSRGTISVDFPLVVYTPNTNAHGIDQFSFQVQTPDGVISSPATVVIQIDPVNDRPVVRDGELTVDEDGALPIDLKTLVTDVDNDSFRFTVTVPPTMGSLTGTPPKLIYRPLPNASGDDGFRFRVNDGSLDSVEGIVAITVNPLNDPPVAVPLTVATVEEMPVVFSIAASDVEADPLKFILVKGPEKGELKGGFPDFAYLPRVDANGLDTITFKVNDGTVDSQLCQVTIQITPVNDTPVVEPQRLSMGEDEELVIRLKATDPDGDPLKYRITSVPAYGDLVGVGTNLVYRPRTNWSGADSFRFLVNDGTVESFEEVVSIEVIQKNDVPIANILKVGLREDESVPIRLTASDVESLDLEYRITVPPSRGTLTGVPPHLVYTPNRDVFGSDSFGFRVNDGTVDSDEVFVSITVDPVNDAPVALVQTASTDEDQPVALTLQGVDVENDKLRFTVTDPPTLGTLSGTPPDLVYTPKSNAFGVDRFQFKVNDGQLDSGRATVVLSVNPVNDAPILKLPASPVVVEARGSDGAEVVFETSAMDVEDGTLKVVVSRPSGSRFALGRAEVFASATDSGGRVTSGSFAVNVVDTTPPKIIVPPDLTLKATGPRGALVEYGPVTVTDLVTASPLIRANPPSGAFFPMGRTEIVVIATDDAGNEGQARFAVTVLNERPVALNGSVLAEEDIPVAVKLSGTDAEGGELSYTVTSGPKLGTLSGSAPHFIYTPATNAVGVDKFSFRVGDGDRESEEAEVFITITPVNDAPVAISKEVKTLEDNEVSITLAGTDVEGQVLTFRVTGNPTQGTLAGSPPNLVYKPAQNLNGIDRFRFRVGDGDLESEEAEVLVTITPVNDMPIAVSKFITLTEDTRSQITLAGTDVEGTTLSYSVATSPTKGKVTLQGNVITYQPNTNAFGADSFTYRASDGETNSLEALVTLLIVPVNDAPDVFAQEVSIPEDTAKAITLTAKDPEGDVLVYSITSQPKLGVLMGTPPNLVYQPSTNVYGEDQFRFKSSDGEFNSAEAVVVIHVTPVNDAPIALAATIETVEETAVKISLKGTDIEGTALTYLLVNPPQKGRLTGTAPDLVYVPNTNATGIDSFTFKVKDDTNESAPAIVTLAIAPLNDPPTAIAQSIVTSEDVAKAVTLSAADPDGDKLEFKIIEGPLHGTLTGSPPNLTYRPETNWSGADRIRFKVGDAISESPEASISITVVPVNDAPIAQSQTVVLKEDSSVTFELAASDAEGTPLKYILSSLPSKGLLAGTPPNLSYTPDEDAAGIDSFTFRVNDGSLDSPKATVTLNIQGVNDAPVALPQSVTVTEDIRKAIFVKGTDVDGDRLVYLVTVQPTLGTLSGVAPNLIYTPRTNAFGTDRFFFRVQDGITNSPEAEVSINIEPVNDAPVILETLVRRVTSGSQLGFQITATDPEVPQEQRLWFERIQGPEGLSVTSEGLVEWRPLSSQGPGSYSAEIRVTDNGTPSRSTSKVLQFQVVPKNDAPNLMLPVDRTIPANTQFTMALSAFDPDLPKQDLTFSLLSGPVGMTLSRNGQLSWRAPAAVKPAIPQVVRVEVSDGQTTVTGSFRLTVVDLASVLPVAVLSGASQSNLVMTVYGLAGVSYSIESRKELGQGWTPLAGVPSLRGLGMDKPVSVALPLDVSRSGFYRIKRP